jgi:hypothetical protein
MADYTDHYGLSRLNVGDSFTDEGYKYTDADRATIDTGIWLGAEGHHHIGGAGTIEEPDTAPELTLEETGGTIPGGTRVYYKYTYVSERGEETAASPEAFIDTPAPIEDPSSPSLTYANTGGILQGGSYYYVLTSYVSASISESKATNPAFITIPSTTATNVITLDLPDPAEGQTGFNVYRRKPGQAKYFFLDTIPTDVATPPTTYEDDGSVEEDCDRTLPKANTTNSTNSITISMPGATPTVPEGYTWKLYRTYINGAWDSSFLVHVVENITEESLIITPEYLDIGISSQSGSPPVTTQSFGNPDPIDLELETDGMLPMGRVNAFPYVVVLSFPGTQVTGLGEGQWPCPFEQAVLVSAIPALGPGKTPVSDDLITDIQIGRGTTPVYTSVYAAQADMPTIPVGENKSETTFPGTATDPADLRLVAGDTITAEIIQAGGSATPTDEDQTISVLLYVLVDDLTSITWD